MSFPDGSVGKESACNAGDPSSIPGLGRSAREGIDIHSSILGLPLCSAGKESTCNAVYRGLISWSGRSAGEGIGYPLQHSCASFVAQLVRNPPAMLETWVWSLGWKDPLEEGKATHSGILAWRIPCPNISLWSYDILSFLSRATEREEKKVIEKELY